MEIVTKRLRLKPLAISDAPSAFAWQSDPEVNRFMSYPLFRNIEQTEKWISSIGEEERIFGIFLIDGNLIGACGIKKCGNSDDWEVGYNLRRTVWGNGYATEAVRAMVDWAHGEFGARVFTAKYATENLRSGRVLEKCGFVFDGNCEYSKTDNSARFQAKHMKLILN